VTNDHPGGDEAIDSAAIRAFTEEFGDRAAKLPPVAIVIAAFNEEGSIGPVVEALPATVCGLEAAAIVVSDGAVDSTAKEARQAGALVCEVPVNRGQGAALRLGYRLARDGGADYIVTTDADGQYNPAEIDSLLAPILAGQADFATGSRTMGSEETRDPVRKLGVRVFALTISLLTGQRVTDTTFGLRAMRSGVTGAVRLEQPQYQAAELLIGVITHGFRVAERPATIHRRTVGKSKKGNNAFYALSFSKVVIGTWWRERQRRAGGGKPGERGERGLVGDSAAAEPLPGRVAAAGTGAAPSAPSLAWPASRPEPPDARSAKST
jgi:glycosyltransferase involved in cell wall biosynthesis